MNAEVISRDYLDEFVGQYLRTALWSSHGDDGEPLDGLYEVSDISDDATQAAYEECKDFILGNAQDLAEIIDAGQAGHDFWLTRNGHGAGFWDRGLGELGDRLTEASKVYGESDLYVGDDGLVHIQ